MLVAQLSVDLHVTLESRHENLQRWYIALQTYLAAVASQFEMSKSSE